MRNTRFIFSLTVIFMCGFVWTAAGQNYYPSAIGNTWVLESADGENRRTYTVERTEIIDGEELTLLEIKNEGPELDSVDIDQYFVSLTDEELLLHQTVFDEGVLGIVPAKFSPPATFFPLLLTVGDMWKIVAEIRLTELLPGREILVTSTTDVEVIAVEDVETPVGIFEACVKVALAQRVSSPFLRLDATSYQWLAPDVGPVKYENSDGIVFELVNSNLLKEEEEVPRSDVTGDGVVDILDLVFVASRFEGNDAAADVNADGTVNILDLVLVAKDFGN